MQSQPDLRKEFLLLGVLALFWGAAYPFTKLAVQDIPPMTLVAFRVSGAAALLLLVMAFRREKLPRDRKTWVMLLIQAFLNSIFAWTLNAWGQQFVDAGLASVLNSTSPIFVFLFTALIIRHETMTGLKFAGAVIGIAGVCLIVGVDALQGIGDEVMGQLACVLGAALYGMAAIYGKRFTHISATATAAGSMLLAAIVLTPTALVVEQPWSINPGWPAILSAMILSFVCSGVAFLIYFRLIRTIGSLGVASQSYLRAGLGVLLGILFLGEEITMVVSLGLAAAILGVALINWPTKRAI